MARSLRVHKDYTKKVKSAVKLNGFARQTDLAEELNLSRATVSNFLNGRPVDYLNFIEICRKLGLDWQAIAQLEDDVEEQDNKEKQEQPVSDFYIERVPYEAQCYQEILKPGTLIRIKAPEQMGKTTLLARVLSQARNQGYEALTISFELADSTVFTDLRQC
jgi:transcriptional regulator with XRE-family HTH domain